jgi:hypothetical protein
MTAFAKSWRRVMTKKRRVYQPRVFDGRIITSDKIERIRAVEKWRGQLAPPNTSGV